MIISASRYTDIPAFYAEWLMRRLRAGYCVVPDPRRPGAAERLPLARDDVEAIVFWTRNASPLLRHLPELDERGYRYYFQYTLMNNPRRLDPKSPATQSALETFGQLAAHVGSARMIWRYDPIVLGVHTGVDFHRRAFAELAKALEGKTERVVISIVDDCEAAHERLSKLEGEGYEISPPQSEMQSRLEDLIPDLAERARAHGMVMQSCSEAIDLRSFGVEPGKCIDDEFIFAAFGLRVGGEKDVLEDREPCRCVTSRDIGAPNSCLHGCQYCYATESFEQSRAHFEAHDADDVSLSPLLTRPPLEVRARKSPAPPRPGPSPSKSRASRKKV